MNKEEKKPDLTPGKISYLGSPKKINGRYRIPITQKSFDGLKRGRHWTYWHDGVKFRDYERFYLDECDNSGKKTGRFAECIVTGNIRDWHEPVKPGTIVASLTGKGENA